MSNLRFELTPTLHQFKFAMTQFSLLLKANWTKSFWDTFQMIRMRWKLVLAKAYSAILQIPLWPVLRINASPVICSIIHTKCNMDRCVQIRKKKNREMFSVYFPHKISKTYCRILSRVATFPDLGGKRELGGGNVLKHHISSTSNVQSSYACR